MDAQFLLQNDLEWLRLKGEHDYAVGCHQGAAQAQAEAATQLGLARAKGVRAVLKELRDNFTRQVNSTWQVVEARRAAWHIHQDKGPEGRRYCTCGCMGRKLPDEVGYDEAEWPGRQRGWVGNWAPLGGGRPPGRV